MNYICFKQFDLERCRLEYFYIFITIVSVVLLGSISPGPNFVIVSHNAFNTRQKGVCAAIGVAVGSLFWASLGVSGLALILSKLPMLHQTLSYLGGAYLVYMGIKILLSLKNKSKIENIELSQNETNFQVFKKGLFTNLSNPKTIIFVSSFFITIIPATMPLWVSISGALIAGAVSLSWYVTVALLLSSENAKHVYNKMLQPINFLLGGFLTYLGGRLIFSMN